VTTGGSVPVAPAGGYADLLGAGPAPDGAFADADFDRLAAAEAGSFWFRARNRLLLATLEAEFPTATSFLEVGCGNGYVLGGVAARHPEMRLVGSDLSEAGLRHARARVPGATLVRADVRELPFAGEFDVVGAFDVIEHIDADEAVLAAMRRAVQPGGGVIVTVPQHRWLWSETDRFSGHQRRYARRELAGKLVGAGLRVRWMTSFTTLLLPLMAASRGGQALSRQPYNPARELSVGRRLDALLDLAMRVEAVAIRGGARLPAGGSLLAVAERT
jgi:SAM-dependent methyltransferase